MNPIQIEIGLAVTIQCKSPMAEDEMVKFNLSKCMVGKEKFMKGPGCVDK